MSARPPVLVLGSGLAGTVAACGLAARGVPVRVVADRPGASALHGGGWLLGAAGQLDAAWPGAARHLDAATAFVREGLGSLDLRAGAFVLPDVEGARRACELAPASHAVVATFGPRVGVVDLVPLGHPFAVMQATGTPIAVDWPPAPDAFGRSFAFVSQRVEAEPALLEGLLVALRTALAGHTVDALLLPPVLGVLRAEAHRRRLVEALGLPVGEALDVLPSAPGLRLHAALSAWRAAACVETETARVSAIERSPLGVRIGDAFRPASAVVLATGRYLTGGLSMHPTVAEPLAALPLAVPVATNPLTEARREGPYDAGPFATGVRVDATMRICGADGRPVHDGLFAAGDVVGGVDVLTSACASGLALAGGYAVALAVAAQEGR
jgi:anaerobic glycerol-3-phosphate dehydrogenase